MFSCIHLSCTPSVLKKLCFKSMLFDYPFRVNQAFLIFRALSYQTLFIAWRTVSGLSWSTDISAVGTPTQHYRLIQRYLYCFSEETRERERYLESTSTSRCRFTWLALILKISQIKESGSGKVRLAL